jgi:hypothetical protein
VAAQHPPRLVDEVVDRAVAFLDVHSLGARSQPCGPTLRRATGPLRSRALHSGHATDVAPSAAGATSSSYPQSGRRVAGTRT